MTKVLLVATVQSHICQFHRPLADMLHAHGCEVHVAARDNLAEKNGLQLDFADQVFDVPFERSPFSARNLAAYKQLKQIVDRGGYHVVHTNTPVGGILGRLAAGQARKKGCQVFYTAHGFHFYQGGPRKSWLIYYPIEKFMCRYTDKLFTITNEDFQLAKERFSVDSCRIHGIGANGKKYVPAGREEQLALRKELDIDADCKVILCTGELNANKNQITAIRAMEQVVRQLPEALLLLAGNGPTEEELRTAIREAGLESHVRLLGYHTDLERFVKASDLIVSCSKREGMPLNIIEGMLCQKPVVASVNRGHRELVIQGETGFLLKPTDVEGFAQKIVELLEDSELSRRLGQAGCARAQAYGSSAVSLELEEIYRKRNVI